MTATTGDAAAATEEEGTAAAAAAEPIHGETSVAAVATDATLTRAVPNAVVAAEADRSRVVVAAAFGLAKDTGGCEGLRGLCAPGILIPYGFRGRGG